LVHYEVGIQTEKPSEDPDRHTLDVGSRPGVNRRPGPALAGSRPAGGVDRRVPNQNR